MANQDSNLSLEQQVALLTQKVELLQANIRTSASNPNLPIAGNYNTYIGARYVPKFANPTEWSATAQYEPLTIVTYQGNSYTSKTFPPVGVVPTNTTYWAATGNYNAQVEAYRQEVLSIQNSQMQMNEDIQDNANEISNIKNKYYIFLCDSYYKLVEPNTQSALDIALNATGLKNISTVLDMGGCGFIGNSSTIQNPTWQNLLSQYNGDISKDKVTDIVILGGINDANYDIDALQTARNNFYTYMRTNFPNAKLSVGHVSWSINQAINYNMGTKTIPFYQSITSIGGKYLNNIEWALHDYAFFDASSTTWNIHPLSAGHQRLGKYLAQCLLNGGCDVNEFKDHTTLNPSDVLSGVSWTTNNNSYQHNGIIEINCTSSIEFVFTNPQGNLRFTDLGTITNGFSLGRLNANQILYAQIFTVNNENVATPVNGYLCLGNNGHLYVWIADTISNITKINCYGVHMMDVAALC